MDGFGLMNVLTRSRRDYFLEHGTVRWTWFNLTEISLGLVFIGASTFIRISDSC